MVAMRTLRQDIAPLSKARTLPNGSLVAEALLTRTGIFEYRNEDGTARRELRLPDEVFHPDALASLALLPVTNDHPDEEVTPENARKYAVGTVGEGVRRAGDYVQASMVIYDADTIAAARAGKRQVSVGYHLDLDETPGTWRGERYDAIQRRIRGNHLAIVEKGRAGPGAAMRIDTKETENMMEIEISGTKYEVDEAIGKRIVEIEALAVSRSSDAEKAQADAKAAADRADAAEAKAATMAGERDAAKARADAAMEQADPAKLQAAIKARVALETSARAHLPAEIALDSLTDRQVREAVVKHASPSADLASASDDYVRARFDAALEQTSPALLAARQAAGNADAYTGEDKAREKMLAANNDAWKQTPAGGVAKGA